MNIEHCEFGIRLLFRFWFRFVLRKNFLNLSISASIFESTHVREHAIAPSPRSQPICNKNEKITGMCVMYLYHRPSRCYYRQLYEHWRWPFCWWCWCGCRRQRIEIEWSLLGLRPHALLLYNVPMSVDLFCFDRFAFNFVHTIFPFFTLSFRSIKTKGKSMMWTP